MYRLQVPGNSNCQGFANSLEHFARGKGYNQVQGVAVAVELPFDYSQTSPIVGWYQLDAEMNPQFHGQFQANVDGFFEAMRKGQSRVPGQTRDVLEAMDRDRYIVLKSGTSGGAGHYTCIQRLKSSGRFILVDPQNQQIFPMLHPDGTPTDEAIGYFNNVTIQAYCPKCSRMKSMTWKSG